MQPKELHHVSEHLDEPGKKKIINIFAAAKTKQSFRFYHFSGSHSIDKITSNLQLTNALKNI